ncbi:MAG: serine hydrolase [Acidimicrobiia bacterium]|nr:serine hydrolase [Acidimicrobiia bacterium]
MRTPRFLLAAAVGLVLTACGSRLTTEPLSTDTRPTDQPAVAGDYPEQPDGVPFPTAEWPVGDLPADVSRTVLDTAAASAFGADDAAARVRSLVVVKGGEIVYERYHPLDGPDNRYNSFSVAKSFTSALVGLAVADGELALDDTGLRPEWAGDHRRDVALVELLQMSSGLQWDEVYEAPSDPLDVIAAQDAAALVAAKPLESEPGTVFEYSTGTTALLVGLVADRHGGCAATADYLHTRLLDSIGITTDTLLTDGDGCWLGGLGADMTTRDFARFGPLYLRGGEWDGRQILPESWIDATRVPAPTNADYGLQWWLGADGVFSAEGLFGQRVVVDPADDLVIAANSTADGDPFTLVDAVRAELLSPTGPDAAPPSATTTVVTAPLTLPPTN